MNEIEALYEQLASLRKQDDELLDQRREISRRFIESRGAGGADYAASMKPFFDLWAERDRIEEDLYNRLDGHYYLLPNGNVIVPVDDLVWEFERLLDLED